MESDGKRSIVFLSNMSEESKSLEPFEKELKKANVDYYMFDCSEVNFNRTADGKVLLL